MFSLPCLSGAPFHIGLSVHIPEYHSALRTATAAVAAWNLEDTGGASCIQEQRRFRLKGKQTELLVQTSGDVHPAQTVPGRQGQ